MDGRYKLSIIEHRPGVIIVASGSGTYWTGKRNDDGFTKFTLEKLTFIHIL